LFETITEFWRIISNKLVSITVKYISMKKFLLSLVITFITIDGFSQQHNQSDTYVKPTDSLVLQKLDTWQDIKFGLLMHWGTYSQWGIVESWSICPEDEGWTQRRGP
jgi:alpha-L-fucosidase